MKNIARILAIVLLTGSLGSCKKIYTCECVTTWFDQSQPDIEINKSDSKAYSTKMKKKQAEAACNEEQAILESTYKNVVTVNGSQSTTTDVYTECGLH